MYTSATEGRFLPFDFPLGQVYALGLTYAGHIRETGERAGQPAVFLKHSAPTPGQTRLAMPAPAQLDAVLAGLDPDLAPWLKTRLDTVPTLLDYEVEIGIVPLEDIPLARLDDPAYAPQLAYTVANDLTARSVQMAGEGARDRLAYWSAAKSLDGFLPLGQRLWQPATADLARLPAVELETRVNGLCRQRASSRELIYTPRQLLASAAGIAPGHCLRRHDLVLTGTPAGIALSIPRWKRRLAAILPRRQRVLAGLRANRGKPGFLQVGDVLSFSAGWLGTGELTIRGPL